MTILFAESDFWIDNLEFREKYARIIRESYAAAKKLLPIIPDNVTFVNQVAPWECMEEYGQGAYTRNSRLIFIFIDDSLPYGEDALLEYTRQTVFHELSHAARFEKGLFHPTLLESAILEGLATVFEREYAAASPPYGDYDPEVIESWLEELQQVGDNESYYPYMYRHADGRKWMAYKVGTYLVDQAIAKSGKNIIKLTGLRADAVLRLSGVQHGS
jgi:uncharacterized protein YjaZ